MPIILCTKNYNFSAKYCRKTSTCPITSAAPVQLLNPKCILEMFNFPRLKKNQGWLYWKSGKICKVEFFIYWKSWQAICSYFYFSLLKYVFSKWLWCWFRVCLRNLNFALTIFNLIYFKDQESNEDIKESPNELCLF